jgi:hypothetical protein
MLSCQGTYPLRTRSCFQGSYVIIFVIMQRNRNSENGNYIWQTKETLKRREQRKKTERKIKALIYGTKRDTGWTAEVRFPTEAKNFTSL